MDYCLKFESKAAADAVLFTQVPTAWDNSGEEPVATEFYAQPNFQNIDVIGVIHKPTGEMLSGVDGVYPEMAPIPGWHVNVRLVSGEDGSALEPFAVTPTSPVRVWA